MEEPAIPREDLASLLKWYVDHGLDETIGEEAIDRFAPPPPAATSAPAPVTAQRPAAPTPIRPATPFPARAPVPLARSSGSMVGSGGGAVPVGDGACAQKAAKARS